MNRERFMPHPVTGSGISVQSDNRARSSSTFAISSLRRGFLASDEILLAAPQGCLVGLNFMKAPAQVSGGAPR